MFSWRFTRTISFNTTGGQPDFISGNKCIHISYGNKTVISAFPAAVTLKFFCFIENDSGKISGRRIIIFAL